MSIFKRGDILQCFHSNPSIRFHFGINDRDVDDICDTASVSDFSRDAHRFNLVQKCDNRPRDFMDMYYLCREEYKNRALSTLNNYEEGDYVYHEEEDS